MIIGALVESVTGLFVDATKERFKDRFNERKLKTELKDYIERQREYNEFCTLAEEIDFQGLVDYISKNMLSDVGIRIFDPNSKTRGLARERIVNSAIAYSKAKTLEAQARVKKCISTCLDIIRYFYKYRHLSIKDYLIMDSIVDSLSDEINDVKAGIISAGNANMATILTALDKNSRSPFSIDKAVSLAKDGKVNIVGDELKEVVDHVSLTHPCYPYYGYDYRDGKMVSKPLTTEAAKLYPPGLRLSGTIKVGNKSYSELNCDVLDYSYRHQAPIMIAVSDALQILGDREDPIQDVAKELIGQTVFAKPPEFPSALPCSIRVGDTSYYDYVLFRTQEIEDDGTICISNKEQDTPFHFEARFNPQNLGRQSFGIKFDGNATSKERLNYLRFLKALSEKKKLHIYVLSHEANMLSCTIDVIDHATGFSSIDDAIDFWDRVCVIEDYFHVLLNPAGEISDDVFWHVIHLSELVKGNEVYSTWDKVTWSFTLNQRVRERFLCESDEMHMLALVGTFHTELFGSPFDVRMARVFKCAHIVDYERVKKKVEVLDDGDELKIELQSGDDKDVFDTLNFPEIKLLEDEPV